MTIATMLSLGETALKLGLICSLTVLALFLSYSMLNVCDLSTDGCFTFGAAVGAVVAVSGHCGSYGGRYYIRIYNGDPADKARCGQPACRYHCEYSIIFCEHCGHGRFVFDQYEPYNNSIYYDERHTCRNFAEGKRGYYNCSNRSDPRDHISGIFPENKTWSCNQGNWK